MSTRDNQESYWGSTEPSTPNLGSSFETTDSFQQSRFSPPDLSGGHATREHVHLSKELADKGYHPVLIFGTRASGKSSLLASLFYYLQSDPASPAIVVKGEWIVPIDTPYGQSVAEAASHFLNHVMNAFHEGKAAPSTRDDYPYYIPVILRPNNGQPEVKLAILESRGEWYAIRRDSRDLYPELRDEVSDVYKNYADSISVLLIAPYLIGEAHGDEGPSELAKIEMRESDAGIFGALQAYQETRQYRDLDKYLFILTKWDEHAKVITSPEFIKPPRGMVSHLIAERFPRSWTLFQNMQTGEAQSMQYSSGLMRGSERIDIPPHLKPIMNQFPKMLWRWLYTNASGHELFDNQLSSVDEDKEHLGQQIMSLFRKFLT
jgi:hypothetical protein